MLGQRSEIAWASPARDSSYSGQILAALACVTNRSFPPCVCECPALCIVHLPARLKSAAVVPTRERETERTERDIIPGRLTALKILRCTLQAVNDPCNAHNFP